MNGFIAHRFGLDEDDESLELVRAFHLDGSFESVGDFRDVLWLVSVDPDLDSRQNEPDGYSELTSTETGGLTQFFMSKVAERT